MIQQNVLLIKWNIFKVIITSKRMNATNIGIEEAIIALIFTQQFRPKRVNILSQSKRSSLGVFRNIRRLRTPSLANFNEQELVHTLRASSCQLLVVMLLEKGSKV